MEANESACKPDSVPAPPPAEKARAANIHLGQPLLTASSSYLQASASNLLGLWEAPPKRGPDALLPGGVYPATPVAWDAGALLPHPFTLTRPQRPGGVLSVALARGSPRVAVSNHPALGSPDFPRLTPATLTVTVRTAAFARPAHSRCVILADGSEVPNIVDPADQCALR